MNKIELKGSMELSVQTPVGPVEVGWSATARLWPTAIVRAPFLLVNLRTGWVGFDGLAVAINDLIEEKHVEGTAEFLKLAAIGKSGHWLELLETRGLEAALSKVKSRMEERGLSPFIEIATRLKNEKSFLEDGYLYVLGEGGSVHKVDVSTSKNHFRFFLCKSLDPSKMATHLERGQNLESYYEGLRRDRVARRRFREFLRANDQPWARKLLADLVDMGLE